MSEQQNPAPLVACICLTRDRPKMLRQAVNAFLAQTYTNKRLVILDTAGSLSAAIESQRIENENPELVFRWWRQPSDHASDPMSTRLTIGELRNFANHYAVTGKPPAPDILCHWDDDDWSHRNRIAEQVDLLQSTSADVVGYNQVLFWQTYTSPAAGHMPGVVHTDYSPKAWSYRDRRKTYAIGSSLCYWTKTWQRRPFQKAPMRPNATGEDSLFIEGLNCLGVSGLPCGPQLFPRMVCRVHGGNSADYSNLTRPGATRGTSFTRAEAFDQYCAEVFSK